MVDDSISTRALVCRTLGQAGYEALEAADGEEALGVLIADSVDAVVTDQWMPNMTGLELIRALRARPDLAHIPILAVTTDSEAELRARKRHTRAAESGAPAAE